MLITKPSEDIIPQYYVYYQQLVQEQDLMSALKASSLYTDAFIRSIPNEKGDFAYAEGKWSIKQVLSHIIDTERILSYRALRFSRFDSAELQGFDEDSYAAKAHLADRTLLQLLDEYHAVRNATMHLFENMHEGMLDFVGTANKRTVTARAIGFFLVGHNLHHCKVISERYLS